MCAACPRLDSIESDLLAMKERHEKQEAATARLAAARALAQTKRLALDAATLAAERKDLMQ